MSQRTSIIAITRKGVRLGTRLLSFLSDSQLYVPARFASEAGGCGFHEPIGEVVRREFGNCRALVLIMAVGIAVRLIAPKLKSKHQDPAVIVVDEASQFVVSLLSGHHGGANALAKTVAAWIGAQPIITTASEVSETIAGDLLGQEFGWEIENEANITKVSAALVNGDDVGIYQDAGERNWWTMPLPESVRSFANLDDLAKSSCSVALVISDRLLGREYQTLLDRAVIYRPKSLAVGIGCNRRTSASQIEEAVNQAFWEHGLSLKSIRNIATIDLKQDEEGLLEFARNHDLSVEFLERAALEQKTCPSGPSEAALKGVGTPGVCEPAALLSSGSTELVVPKMKLGEVTVAVARVPAGEADKTSCGKLFLVGLGPGDPKHMTFRAREALAQSNVVVGYETYIKLVEGFLLGKKVVSSGMGEEIERIRLALELAESGETVSVVCSGDSGIYGMAGLVGEMAKERENQTLEVEIVPGVPSLASSAALLGAPVTSDFVTISLSDYLVRWEDILRHLETAAQGNFVIILYNPKSKYRRHQLAEAREILLRYRKGSTPVGVVSNGYRPGQQVIVTDLNHMLDFKIGMTTTIVVGNSTTFIFRDWMVTPRGYGAKYKLDGD